MARLFQLSHVFYKEAIYAQNGCVYEKNAGCMVLSLQSPTHGRGLVASHDVAGHIGDAPWYP